LRGFPKNKYASPAAWHAELELDTRERKAIDAERYYWKQALGAYFAGVSVRRWLREKRRASNPTRSQKQ
jgi:hypothetical protein